MAYPSVTYVFVNATTASASEVNQNFTDLVNGMSDGTKDLNVNALTVAGTATLNGAVNLGNASGDDITANGYFASALIPKTDDTYDLGTAALAWQDAYFEGTVYTDALSQLGTGGISVTGALIPNADDTHDLGTAALTWQDAYFDGAVYTDTISEHTAAAGVIIDETKLKDGGVILKTGSQIEDAGGAYVKIYGGNGGSVVATGYVGEYLTAAATVATNSAGVAFNVTSKTMTAGTWLVVFHARCTRGAIQTYFQGGLGNNATNTAYFLTGNDTTGGTTGEYRSIGHTEVYTVSTATVLYLNATCGGANNVTVNGWINATRLV